MTYDEVSIRLGTWCHTILTAAPEENVVNRGIGWVLENILIFYFQPKIYYIGSQNMEYIMDSGLDIHIHLIFSFFY